MGLLKRILYYCTCWLQFGGKQQNNFDKGKKSENGWRTKLFFFHERTVAGVGVDFGCYMGPSPIVSLYFIYYGICHYLRHYW